MHTVPSPFYKKKNVFQLTSKPTNFKIDHQLECPRDATALCTGRSSLWPFVKIKNSRSQFWRHKDKDLGHHHHDQCPPSTQGPESDEIYFYLRSLASTITLSVGWITNSTERWWIFPGLLPHHLGAELTTNNKHYHRYIHNIQHCSHHGWPPTSTVHKKQEISKFCLQNRIVLILILQVITSPSLCSGHWTPLPMSRPHRINWHQQSISQVIITSLLSPLNLKALKKSFTISHWHQKQQFKAQAVVIQYVFTIQRNDWN